MLEQTKILINDIHYILHKCKNHNELHKANIAVLDENQEFDYMYSAIGNGWNCLVLDNYSTKLEGNMFIDNNELIGGKCIIFDSVSTVLKISNDTDYMGNSTIDEEFNLLPYNDSIEEMYFQYSLVVEEKYIPYMCLCSFFKANPVPDIIGFKFIINDINMIKELI